MTYMDVSLWHVAKHVDFYNTSTLTKEQNIPTKGFVIRYHVTVLTQSILLVFVAFGLE